MRNIIFLDIDGVLFSADFFENAKNYKKNDLCPKAVANLNKITDATDADLVITSSWLQTHSLDEIARILKKNGVKAKVVDNVRKLKYKSYDGKVPRGCSVRRWTEKNIGEWTNYVILDDEEDFLISQSNRFVKTTYQHGLLEEHAQQAIDILNFKLRKK